MTRSNIGKPSVKCLHYVDTPNGLLHQSSKEKMVKKDVKKKKKDNVEEDERSR